MLNILEYHQFQNNFKNIKFMVLKFMDNTDQFFKELRVMIKLKGFLGYSGLLLEYF